MERLRLAHETWEMVRDRLAAFLADRHPTWSREEIQRDVARRLLDDPGRAGPLHRWSPGNGSAPSTWSAAPRPQCTSASHGWRAMWMWSWRLVRISSRHSCAGAGAGRALHHEVGQTAWTDRAMGSGSQAGGV